MAFRSGLVAIVGPPNAGKSTLVNLLVGQHVTIVSDKAQTTRRRILGIVTEDDFQIVLVDTPGVHKPHNRLGRLLNETAERSLDSVDATLVMVDGSRKPSPDDRDVAALLARGGHLAPEAAPKLVLCMNKMDRLKAENVQLHYDAYTALFPGATVMMTSLTKRRNIDLLVGLLVDRLPEGPMHFDADQVTDQTTRSIVAEIVREKALQLTRQEVPHALATTIESWDESNPKLTRISVIVMVEREGQKAILIGKGGSMLREIGTKARAEIEALLEKKVFLELFVRVRPDWRESTRLLRELELMD